MQEFGLDIGRDWGVNESGLSNHACCSPKCPHYLDLLNHNLAIPSDVTCPRLRTHLMINTDEAPLPAFHKTVTAFKNHSAHRVADKVESGACLEDPILTKADLESFMYLEHRGMTKQLEHKRAAIIEAKKSKVIQYIKATWKEINAKESKRLHTDISLVQSELMTTTWNYNDFKSLFITKYKKHSRLFKFKTPNHPEWQQYS
jgi:hypothetical protein